MDVGSAAGCWDGCEEKVKVKVKRGKGWNESKVFC
jgi:hypothetical protein